MRLTTKQRGLVLAFATVIIAMSVLVLKFRPHEEIPAGKTTSEGMSKSPENGTADASVRQKSSSVQSGKRGGFWPGRDEAAEARPPASGRDAPAGRKGKRVSLFSGGEKEEEGPTSANPAAVRSREVGVNPDFSDGKLKIEPGDEVALDLFDNASLSAAVTSTSKNVKGTISVSGDLNGKDGGRVYLSCNGGKVAGFVEVPSEGKFYSIGVKDGATYVFEDDPAKIDDIKDSTVEARQPSVSSLRTTTSAATSEGGDGSFQLQEESGETVTVDILVLHTPAAGEWAAGSPWGGGGEHSGDSGGACKQRDGEKRRKSQASTP